MRYWTTADRPSEEQFSYWREVICEAFTPLAAERRTQHRPAGPRESGIQSWVRSQTLTTTNCAEVSSRTQLVLHGASEVRRTTSDVVFVNLQLSGHCVAGQGGRTCIVPPGSFAVFDTTSEYSLEFHEDPSVQEWRLLSFRVPRAQLVPLVTDPETVTAVTYNAATDAPANLVASTMLSIWRNIDGLGRGPADAAESAFTSVLAAGVGGTDELRHNCAETLDATLRAEVNRYLAANLRAADLSAACVARRFGISIRKLHRIYEGTGRSFRQTIMSFRIQACARDLTVNNFGGSLTEMAVKWGFCDLSHLNRLFRAQYGCLPSDFRDRQHSVPAATVTADHAPTELSGRAGRPHAV